MRPISFPLALFLGLFLFACSSDKESQTASESTENQQEEQQKEPKSLTDALTQMEESINDLQSGEGKKEVVNFRELKKLLPEKVAGMERTKADGETAGAFGFNVSSATGEYASGQDGRVEITITDVAGFGAAMMGLASWYRMDFDRESGDTYERTSTYDGYKTYEKYNSATREGELAAIVSDRFIVSIKGRDVDMKDLKGVLEDMDLKDLKGLN